MNHMGFDNNPVADFQPTNLQCAEYGTDKVLPVCCVLRPPDSQPRGNEGKFFVY